MNRRYAAGLIPALLGASLAFGQDQSRPERDRPGQGQGDRQMNRQPGGREMGMSGMQQKADVLIKCKNIAGAKVVNRQNEKLGTIDDVLIESRSGYVVYGILEHGGVLGIGDKKVAIPWNALEVLPTSDGDATVGLDTTADQ